MAFDPMPFDLAPLDLLALLTFFGLWGGYNVIFRLPGAPASLNLHMRTVREVWMRNMQARDTRLLDGQLLGHLIQSVSFFASTTVLLIAGDLSALVNADRLAALVDKMHVASTASGALIEVKLFLLLGVLVYAFFQFTWAVRQYNYTCALIGAMPDATNHPPSVDVEEAADAAAALLSLAVQSFNAGVRAYYFGFAALGWFVHPLAFMASTALVIVVLVRRHFHSRAFHAVRRFGTAVRMVLPERTRPLPPEGG
ncbi:DUF599 domain-containing protein [Nitrospirillum sp. BR 11752]|uniref:DUF599 domain-containing protein n=1 Tax=Nitrospirillum sp. BR 11752 TaxID=3104293 RepID=UPI002EA1573B|nr:DUF599 domain-containing protein [Nitrospirillum sp. BR 11752]